MPSPGLVILGVVAVGAVFVLLPVALTSLAEYRRARRVECPEKRESATVTFDAGRAMRASLVGRIRLRVVDCSFWPEKSGCAQGCAASAAPKRVE
jgi:hypothetical protein